MTSSNKQRGKKFFKAGFWTFEHILIPAFLALLFVLMNNHFQAKKQPNLVAHAEEHQIMKISENEFKIECPFTILNSGGSTTKQEKVTLCIPRSLTIDHVDISEEYKGFYTEENGGSGHNYVVYSVALPRGKRVEGTVVVFSNTEIPEKSMCPLRIVY